jgi:hypothetical protein
MMAGDLITRAEAAPRHDAQQSLELRSQRLAVQF